MDSPAALSLTLLLALAPAGPSVLQEPQLAEAAELLGQADDPAALRRALVKYEAHVAHYPQDPDGYLGAATALIRLRRSPEAVRLLREAHAIVPENEAVLYNLAATLHNQSLYAEAIESWRALRDLAEVKPELAQRVEWVRFWGQAASDLGLTPEALEAYERCVRLAPDNPAYRAELAHELLQAARFEEAVAHLERVVALVPGNGRYHYLLGWALLKVGRDEDAERELQRAVELDPNLLDAHLKLGTLYSRQQHPGEAVVSYRNALRVNSLSVEALHALGRLLSLTGDKEGAEDARRRYEEVSALADERTEALRDCLRRVAAEPDNVKAYEDTARFYIEQNDVDGAEPWLMRLLWRDPYNEQALLNMSSILALRGDLDSAMLEVEKLLDKDPGNTQANLRAGRIRCSQRRWKEALPYLERALPGLDKQRAEVEVLIEAARLQARSTR